MTPPEKMIYKSIVTALILCSAYSVIAYRNLDSAIRPLNQRQGNLVKCQEYVFRDCESAEHIITGSSMAYRLRDEFLPPSYYNLALGGQSSFIGLELVNRSPSTPKVVFVEMNTVLRSFSTSLIDGIFERPNYDVKKNVLITRDKFQFIPFLINQANQCFSKSDAQTKSTNSDPKIDQATLRKRVDLQKASYSKLPSQEKMQWGFDRLDKSIAALENKNIRIVFFEMPMHPELRDSKLFSTLRKQLSERFPPSEYQYILVQEPRNFTTTDGLHLIDSSAKKMAEYLVSEFNQKIHIETDLPNEGSTVPKND